MSAASWAVLSIVLAWAAVGLRVVGVLVISLRRVPAWSGPLAEALLWIGGPAILDPSALSNGEFWLGLVAMLLLWGPVMALASPPSTRRRAELVVLTVYAVVALGVQVGATQTLLAGTVNEATHGQVCQGPRKIIIRSGEDLFPAPSGTVETLCVQGRPGGGYIGD